MKLTRYEVFSEKISRSYLFVVAADLHNREYKDVVRKIADIKPDAVLVPGDLCHNLNRPHTHRNSKNGFGFLREAAEIAPTFYSLGNHEKGVTKANYKRVMQTGAVLLNDRTVSFGEVNIAGLSSGLDDSRLLETPPPDTEFLKVFDKLEGFKLLLCHHPEYYPRYIENTKIDLTVSGHAHGGQWSFFGRGVFAPGQGLFPKYTNGIHENRLVISRGLTNTCHPIPRIFNPTELVIIELKPKR